MTYLADDSGIQTSKPVVLFEFTNTLGTVTRRTSYQHDFVFGGNTYTATAGLKAGSFVMTGGMDVPEMTIELAIADAVTSGFAGAGVVPQKWQASIIWVQRTSGLSERFFKGYVRTVDLRIKASGERTAVFTVTSQLDDGPNTPIPNVIYSKLCNHVLYDSLCAISRAANTINPTIATIAADFRTITVSSISPFTSTDAEFGDAIHPVSGERRNVVSQNGTAIVLDVPLPSLGPLAAATGHVLTLSRGCNRLVTTCRDKYNNVGNFGGHPQFVDGNSKWMDSILKLFGVA